LLAWRWTRDRRMCVFKFQGGIHPCPFVVRILCKMCRKLVCPLDCKLDTMTPALLSSEVESVARPGVCSDRECAMPCTRSPVVPAPSMSSDVRTCRSPAVRHSHRANAVKPSPFPVFQNLRCQSSSLFQRDATQIVFTPFQSPSESVSNNSR
jgi:hypothetical protein